MEQMPFYDNWRQYMKGTWMDDITQKPTLAEKIKFGHDASDWHLYWADFVKEHPDWIPYIGDSDFHEEAAVLHEETAIELEEMAKQQGEKNPGCLQFGRLFRRR